MAKEKLLTGVEQFFNDDDIIVSKTDLKGHLTYTNKVFLDISGYTEAEIIGKPHNIIRHPEMPRCIFKVLWDSLKSGKEIFAYVNNRTKCGDYYWVYAHVTPSWNSANEIIGYHSNRRVPDRSILDEHIIPLYTELWEEENRHANRKDGILAAEEILVNKLLQQSVAYDEYIATVGQRRRRGYR
ncbi:MAG: PAS domain-containing protein [Rhizobiales bacterium]|nr:PAS domain-containing protein [Hyphomicrobiales bacterium]